MSYFRVNNAIISFFLLISFVMSCTIPSAVNSNISTQNRIISLSNEKITVKDTHNQQNKDIIAKIVSKDGKEKKVDVKVGITDSTQKPIKDRLPFSTKSITSVTPINTTIGSAAGTMDITYEVLTDRAGQIDDNEAWNLHVIGPNVQICQYFTLDINATGSGTFTVTIPDDYWPSGIYNATYPNGGSGTITVNNNKPLSITSDKTVVYPANGEVVNFNVLSGSPEFWDFQISGSVGTGTLLSCQQRDSTVTWSPSASLPAGDYTIKAFLKVFPSIVATTTVKVAYNLPSPTPISTIPPPPTDCKSNLCPTGLNEGVNTSNNLVKNIAPSFKVKALSDTLNNNDSIRNSLRQFINNAYQDNSFSTETPLNFNSLSQYQSKLNSMAFDFDFYISEDQNIAEALHIISEQSQIYSEVSRASFNQSEKTIFLENLTKSITANANVINIEQNRQLQEDLKIRTELVQELPEAQEEFQKAIVFSLVKQGILNPDTLAINPNPQNTFRVQANTPIGDAFNKAWGNIKSSYGSASNFILTLEKPILDRAAGLIFKDWDRIKANDPDQADKILEDLRDASIILPAGPEDMLPCGKGAKIANKVGSFVTKEISDLFLKELEQALKKNPDLANKIKNIYNKTIDLVKPSSNSKILGDNILKSSTHPQKGIPKPDGWQAHHIVSEKEPNAFAQKSRNLLERNGIDYKKDAYNGINLPTGKTTPKRTVATDPNFPNVINHTETFGKKNIENKPISERKELLKQELTKIQNDFINGVKFWRTN